MTPTLVVLRCTECGRREPDGRRYCSACNSDVLTPQPVSGHGTLVTWTVIRRPPETFAGAGPFAVALVDLDEGVRVTARLAGVVLDDVTPEPALGAGVHLVGMEEGLPIVEVSAI